VNLALRDVRYRPGRFVLTALGLGLLLATVMAMGGIYQGLVLEALSIVHGAGADLWVVQKDTNGPFAETSRVPDDLWRGFAPRRDRSASSSSDIGPAGSAPRPRWSRGDRSRRVATRC
jgi:hypothetical protein